MMEWIEKTRVCFRRYSPDILKGRYFDVRVIGSLTLVVPSVCDIRVRPPF